MRSLSQFHVGERHLLMGIWTDRSRHVYVASYGTREVKKIFPDERVEVVARSSPPYSPTGGLIAPNGDLWLLEYSGPIPDRVRVRRMTPGGRSHTF